MPVRERDLTKLADDQLINQRKALRIRLEQLPLHVRQRASLAIRYDALTDEFDRRARAAWNPLETQLPASRQGMIMENNASTENDLHDFERTYFERLRLAAQVIIEAAPDLEFVTDPLEAELQIFKERVELLLLLPMHADTILPWRKLLNGQEPSSPAEASGQGPSS
jgi:hypothetical protein